VDVQQTAGGRSAGGFPAPDSLIIDGNVWSAIVFEGIGTSGHLFGEHGALRVFAPQRCGLLCRGITRPTPQDSAHIASICSLVYALPVAIVAPEEAEGPA
jgi:hypothetical protein